MVDFLLELYKLGKLNELKDGVHFGYSKMESSFCVITRETAYSLNTENLMEALEKFYTKEILSDKNAKRYLDFLKSKKIFPK